LASVNSGLYVEGQANQGIPEIEGLMTSSLVAFESATKQAQQRGRRGWARRLLSFSAECGQQQKYWHSFFSSSSANCAQINVWRFIGVISCVPAGHYCHIIIVDALIVFSQIVPAAAERGGRI